MSELPSPPAAEADTKPWWQSRTVWFNVLTALLLLLDAFASSLGLLQPLLPPAAWPWVACTVTVINLWLRAITRSGLTWRKDGA